MQTNLPTFESYGRYSSDNYGAHTLRIHFDLPDASPVCVWFSYTTPVAFAIRGQRTVRVNEWGPTTGKHLNWIDGGDKAARVSGEEFQRMYSEALQTSEATTQ